jgi:predicted signal transduction protein with EAL and GGDEF domain
MGDEALRVFARVVNLSMRGSDIIGRLGGEEFAAIVSEPMETAERIAERIRAGFESAGAVIVEKPIGATVSIGAVTSYEAVEDIDALIARADVALYRAKRDGRNRIHGEQDEPLNERTRMIAVARSTQAKRPLDLLRRKKKFQQVENDGVPAGGSAATSHLLYRR